MIVKGKAGASSWLQELRSGTLDVKLCKRSMVMANKYLFLSNMIGQKLDVVINSMKQLTSVSVIFIYFVVDFCLFCSGKSIVFVVPMIYVIKLLSKN